MCGKGVNSWTVSSSTRAVKVEQISPLFHLYLYLFFKSEEHPSVLCQPGMPSTVQTDIHREYGSRLMAKEEKSAFQISSLLLRSFISNIYTPERLLLAKSAKQSKGKGVSRSQLQCQATTALRKNSVHLNRARVIEINVCEL